MQFKTIYLFYLDNIYYLKYPIFKKIMKTYIMVIVGDF